MSGVILTCLVIAPHSSIAQSEEDILESIGSELESEEEKKKELEKKEKEYDDLKGKADGYLKGQKYDKAKDYYKQMAKIFPDRDYPKRQIQLADQLFEREQYALKEEQYNELIASADQLLADKKWDAASAKFKEASAVLPEESYPKQKIQEITAEKAAAEKARLAAEKQKKYDDAITQADQALNAQKWDDATRLYKVAIGVKPDEKYPKDQIAQTAKLKKEAAERAADEARTAKYNEFIGEADQLLANKKWDEATAKYQAASKVKPDESYPKDKIVEIGTLKKQEADRKAQEVLLAKYNNAIGEADKLFKSGDWDAAIAQYQVAKGIKSDESYPDDQIQLSETKRQAEQDAKEAAKKQNEYEAIIKEADALFASKKFDDAIVKYESAQSVLPNEAYPREQIEQAEAAKQRLEQAAQEAELQANFDAAMTAGNQLLANDEFDAAIAKFKEAQGILPNDATPAAKIKEAELKQQEKAASEAQAEKEAAYNQKITEADALFNQGDLEGSISTYKEALGIIPNSDYPTDQISKAETKIRERELAAEEAELRNAYNDLIAKGDEAFENKDYSGAKLSYNEASELMPSEKYPSKKLEEIQAIETQNANEAEREAKYASLLAQANTQIDDGLLKEALVTLDEAKGYTDSKDEVDAKIESVKGLITEAEIASKQEQKQAEIRSEYEELVQKGDAAFSAGEWTDASSNYKLASNLLPDEPYPMEQLAKVEASKQAEEEARLAAAQEEAEAAAEIEASFNAALDAGNLAFENEAYQEAISSYENALAIKSGSERAKSQLELAKSKLALQEEEKERARNAELAAKQAQEEVSRLIAEGKQAINSGSWAEARQLLKQAETNASENEEVKTLLEDVDRLEAEEQAKLAEAEEAERAAREAREEEYSLIISKAESKVQEKAYEEAIVAFKEASELKPEAQGPLERIAEVERLMKKAKEEADRQKEQAAQLEKLESDFANLIAEGEGMIQAANWVEARNAFKQAGNLFPDREVVQTKLDEVDRLEAAADEEAARIRAEEEAKRKAEEAARLAEQQAAEKYQQAIDSGDEFLAVNNFDKAEQAYEEALIERPEAEYPQTQLAELGRLRAEFEAEQRAEAERQQQLAEARERAQRLAEEKRKEELKKRLAEQAEARKKAREERLRKIRESSPEALAQRYPSGLTKEQYQEGIRKVTKVVIIESGRGRQLLEYAYPWGRKFYFLNGKQITGDAYHWDQRNYN